MTDICAQPDRKPFTIANQFLVFYLLLLSIGIGNVLIVKQTFEMLQGRAAEIGTAGNLRWLARDTEALLLGATLRGQGDAEVLHTNLRRADAAIATLQQGAGDPGIRNQLARLRTAWASMPLQDSFAQTSPEKMAAALDTLHSAATDLFTQAQALVDTYVSHSQAIERTAMKTLYWLALFDAALIVAGYIAVRTNIVSPLKKITAVARRLSTGDYAVRTGLHSADEIGEMGKAFDRMADEINRHVDRLSEDMIRIQLEQQALRKLSLAVERSPTPVLITDHLGKIEYANQKSREMAEYGQHQPYGEVLDLFGCGFEPMATRDEMWQALVDGREWCGELLCNRPGKTALWERISISPIADAEASLTHFVVIREDITTRKNSEMQLEDLVAQRTRELQAALEAVKLADQSKDEFLANITHELRTPLSAVIGFASLARAGCTDLRQRDYLDKVSDAGKMLSSIIDDLLDLSKIVAGRLRFESRPFSLRQLLIRTRSVVGYKAAEKHLDLMEHVAEDVPDILIGDSLRIEQILLNLLCNAVKFTCTGRVKLNIGVEEMAGPRICLRITVTDTGVGMHPDDIPLLFKPFSQTDASVTRRFGGTGLGLAICKHLAELMEGDIQVSSREGEGSTFVVRLWLGVGDTAPEESEPLERMPLRYENVHVLVVDDQPFNREIVEGLLAMVGISATFADNGLEAIAALDKPEPSFDLVLMDVQMPIMDGITATREIRTRDALAELPVVAMTAHMMAHERDRYPAAGFSDYMGKPFDEGAFYRLLAHWIPSHKQRRTALPPTGDNVENGMPPMCGIDVRAGLALQAGDAGRYIHWLQRFCSEAPARLSEIETSLAKSELGPVRAWVHVLKGQTGMLGMTGLHATAAALEMALDTGVRWGRPLKELQRGLDMVCAEIRNVLGAPTEAEDIAQTTTPRLPEASPPPEIGLLIDRLRAGDSECDQLIEDCLRQLENSLWMPHLRQALRCCQSFDYDGALHHLTASSSTPP